MDGGIGDDSLDGGDNADVLTGDEGNDLLSGGNSADTLFGGNGNDSLLGGDGDDSISGGSGDDTLQGGAGADRLDGNQGLDIADYSNSDGAVTIRLEIGQGVATGGHATGDTLSGVDGIIGSGFADSLVGFDGQGTSAPDIFTNIISGGAGNDTIDGRAGDDSLFGGDDDDSIIGQAGNDFISGDAGNDALDGGADNDTLAGGAGRDSLVGGTGNDSLDGGGDNDTLFGDAGTDVLNGGSGEDQLFGGTGNDVLAGGDDNDTLSGGENDDVLQGQTGDDSLSGDAGNDVLDGGSGNDTLLGGEGADNLAGGENDDQLFGGNGNDTLTGGQGADALYGGTGRDEISGGTGNDTFFFALGDVDSITGTETVFGGGGAGAGPDDTDRIDVTAFGIEYGWSSVVIVRDSTNPNSSAYEDGFVYLFSGPGPYDPINNPGDIIGTIRFENIESFAICFTPGTMILTDRGEVAVEALCAGDMVMTRDNGLQPLRWVGHRRLTQLDLVADPDLQPVRIAKDALRGEGPARSMMVSPQHRVLITGARAELLFGTDEVLVPAKHLVGQADATRVLPEDGVTYIHLLFDRHEIVQSDGIWTESFQPAERSLNALEAEVRDEILKLFPELAVDGDGFLGARLSLKAHEARVLLAS
jgi:Ca2+-binding RTX toxin-like protein